MLTVLFAAPFNISVAGEVQIQFGTFDLPPYAFYDGDGRGRGMLREINSEISDKAGLTHADRVMPLKRVHKELVKGDVACATFIPAPWSKSDLVQVAEITSELTSIIVPKKGLVISNFEDLHGLTMAIPRGSYSGMAVMTNGILFERLHRLGHFTHFVAEVPGWNLCIQFAVRQFSHGGGHGDQGRA